ncbi:MAG TPA: hypothetical protein PKC24_03190 [Cyclobacteriaceae bacterium]|nr:hypothetical protein [Cyclobacteriaceae bacterium]
MRCIYLLLFITFTGNLQGQNLEELERRKGFKDIKLESNINEIEGAEFKKDIKEAHKFDAKLYLVKNENYSSIGDIKVRTIELKVYNDKIYEINLVTDKDTRLMKSLEEAFGKAQYNVRADSYQWYAETLSLSFTSKSKKELQLVYRSASIIKEMSEDKKEDIKKISSDF